MRKKIMPTMFLLPKRSLWSAQESLHAGMFYHIMRYLSLDAFYTFANSEGNSQIMRADADK